MSSSKRLVHFIPHKAYTIVSYTISFQNYRGQITWNSCHCFDAPWILHDCSAGAEFFCFFYPITWLIAWFNANF